MGKKCVQLVKTLSRKLSITVIFTQWLYDKACRLGRNREFPQHELETVHKYYSPVFKSLFCGLYTVSTMPTITTIYFENKETITTV